MNHWGHEKTHTDVSETYEDTGNAVRLARWFLPRGESGGRAHWREGLGSAALRATPRGSLGHMEGGTRKGGIP